jgi:hypothetical protein
MEYLAFLLARLRSKNLILGKIAWKTFPAPDRVIFAIERLDMRISGQFIHRHVNTFSEPLAHADISTYYCG